MSRFKLPGSSLLDRCIGRSTFQYTQAIQLKPFKNNLMYDSYIKTVKKYQPTKSKRAWYYTTPFGRDNICRVDLASSKRTHCLSSPKQSDDAKDTLNDINDGTHIEIYEYCVGSIRNSLFQIGSSSLLPSFINEYIINIQYRLACYFTEKRPYSAITSFFDSLYRIKLIDSKSFTSTETMFFPKWCSSIALIRVLKSKDIDYNEFVDKLNEEHIGDNIKGKSDVNLSKDINHELEIENADSDETIGYKEFPMKDEYQSEFIRNYNELTKFDNSFDECNEIYLVLSTRYSLGNNDNFIVKLLWMPHWLTVKYLSYLTHTKVLKDLGDYLEFMAEKDLENQKEEHHLHKLIPRKKKKEQEQLP